MENIIEKAKKKFIEMIEEFPEEPYCLSLHVPEAEKWAKFLLEKYPQADREIVLLSIWLHDLGHYPVPTEVDHAIRGKERAEQFLKEMDYDPDKIKAVSHCVRSHRCKEGAMPKTSEAKIIAFADSASHMTGDIYLNMVINRKKKGKGFGDVYEKMERDFRDLEIFPEIKEQLTGLWSAWKKLIEEYEKLDL